MKSGLLILSIGLFALILLGTLVIAENETAAANGSDPSINPVNTDDSGLNNGTAPSRDDRVGRREDRRENRIGIGQELRERIRDTRQEIKEGNYTGPMGRRMMVREISQDLREIRMNESRMRTRLNVSLGCNPEDNETDFNNCSKVMDVMLRNGSLKEIKIMPDTASDRAIERLGLKVCNESNNCTIELKDVGRNQIEKLKYEVMVERHRKLFGMFRMKSLDQAEVDPQTGETIVKKPWWAFLAKDEAQ